MFLKTLKIPKIQYNAKGFTLIECMIALLLGSMLSAIAMNMYLKSADFSRVSKSHQLLNDSGSTALTLIGGYIRDAGFSDIDKALILSTVMIDQEFCNLNACSQNNNNNSDVLALQVTPLNQRTCNGEDVGSGEKIVNVFEVRVTPNVDPDKERYELICSSYLALDRSKIGTPIIIQSGIENMQIQYLLNDGTFTSNQQLTQQGNEDVVVGVSVAFLVRSEIDNTVTPSMREFILLDAPTIKKNDSRLRQVFQSSFLINNSYVKSNLTSQ